MLLCSEAAPDRCHRRLAAEYLADRWGDVTIEHLWASTRLRRHWLTMLA